MAWLALWSLLGCVTQSGLPLEQAQGLTVRQVTEHGLRSLDITRQQRDSMTRCVRATRAASAGPSSPDVLYEPYLLEVQLPTGGLTFELYTPSDLKGNKGKHYRNGCMYDLLRVID